MPGIAVIKCRLCERKGPLLRGSEKEITTWLKAHGWLRGRCPACVRGEKEGESDLDVCKRRVTQLRANAGLPPSGSRKKKGRVKRKRRRAPRVKVLTETHLPSKFRTQQRVEWDAKHYGWGWLSAEVIGVRDKLGHYRYMIRLDVTRKKLLGPGRFGEIEVSETALRVLEEAACPS